MKLACMVDTSVRKVAAAKLFAVINKTNDLSRSSQRNSKQRVAYESDDEESVHYSSEEEYDDDDDDDDDIDMTLRRKEGENDSRCGRSCDERGESQ